MKVFLRNGSGSIGYFPKKSWPLPHNINKNKFQVGCKPKCEWLRKKLEDKVGEYIYDLRKGKHFVKCYKKRLIIKEILINWVTLKLRTSTHHNIPLREWKSKSHRGRRYLYYTYLTKDSYPNKKISTNQ